MEKRKLGFFISGLLVPLLVLGSSAYSDYSQQRWRGKEGLSEDTMSPMVLNRVGPSIVFPLHGNVYPDGYYNVTINVGEPSEPYFLDVDTGSDLTWLQCYPPFVRRTEAPHPLYRAKNLVPCNDPICASLNPTAHRCDSPERCVYQVEYADGGYSIGVLVKDKFLFNLRSGMQIKPPLSFGCGYKQTQGAFVHPLDGVLGLGRGKSSIISQLSSQGLVRNVIGHCMSRRGGGFLFFGDVLYDSSDVTWISMSHNLLKQYSPGFADLYFDGEPTGIGNLLIVFDSGSSYTYFSSPAYEALISWVKKELSRTPLTEVEEKEDKALPLCWKGKRPFKHIHDIEYFKPLLLSFKSSGKSKTQFDMPPEDFLIISSKGNVCLGILNGTQEGLDNLNIIGDISMQDRMVIYDNEKQVIGWSPADCDKLPGAKEPLSDDC